MRNLKFILLIFLLGGCEFLQIKDQKGGAQDSKEEPIARVMDKYLYPRDLEGIIGKNDIADSSNIIKRYIKNWIRKQLLIDAAEKNIAFDEAEIQRKILDYRYALMVYEFQKHYVNNQLDTQLTDNAIKQYYQENIDNFQLKQNIIRGIYVKVAKDAPRTARISKLIRSEKEKDFNDLKAYCFSYASNYFLEDSVWVNFNEIIKNTPFADIPNKVTFVKNNDYVMESDEKYHYYLRIKEYKITDQISPLEFVREDIKNIILNRRKAELAKNLEEQILTKAEENDDFEIFE